MKKLEVFGAAKLKGQIKISGSKNASLPILAATLISDKKIFLSNLPRVKDVETMTRLLESMGSKVKLSKNKNSLVIQNNKKIKTEASYNLMSTMRAGIIVLGPLLARFGEARVSSPGGCNIGFRPIDIHLEALKKMGVEYKIVDGYINAKAKNGLIGTKIKFPKISVGATENLMIAACLAKGQTILSNCAIEPEIKDLSNFLCSIGAKITWTKKRQVKITGIKTFKQSSYKIMFDRIEAGTMLIAAAINESNLKITGIESDILKTEINVLKKIGTKINQKKNQITIKGNNKIKSINLKTAPYPDGWATDLQAQMMVLLCKANKRSMIKEEIFENRFQSVPELKRMNAKIKVKGNQAIIEGNTIFKGAQVMATDLRASASLVLAALCAEGKTTISRIYHLDRGYEDLEKKLRKVGAKIKRIS
ncbi:UDP-N-acetylglucosamine 1-carboxyvinyltransferase [Candidatus Pelagibacter sp.]|jgi:UDP-N-acetylglucosamine 1-carboxyvinyltransferase|nr:UDP-N-acetylglucosamine 1-carboxyvinyltransferase [Candidatus Pelagibacter sp.]